MQTVNMILAVGPCDVIGMNNTLPWHSKQDFYHFRKMTENKPCIFGKTTFFNLPRYPLPNRLNIVLTSSIEKDIQLEHGYILIKNLDIALQIANSYASDTCYICGGLSLFDHCLTEAKVDNVILTRLSSHTLEKAIQDNPNSYVKFESFSEKLNDKYKCIEEIDYSEDEKYQKIVETNDILVNYYRYTKK